MHENKDGKHLSQHGIVQPNIDLSMRTAGNVKFLDLLHDRTALVPKFALGQIITAIVVDPFRMSRIPCAHPLGNRPHLWGDLLHKIVLVFEQLRHLLYCQIPK